MLGILIAKTYEKTVFILTSFICFLAVFAIEGTAMETKTPGAERLDGRRAAEALAQASVSRGLSVDIGAVKIINSESC
ncbi:MAG: hypothetical protein ACI9Y1_002115 [Lentisphaeria bacterium]